MMRRVNNTLAKDATAGSKLQARSRQQRHAVAIICVGTLGVAMAAASLTISRPALVWNFSPSVPEGLYRLDNRLWSRGDLVALRPVGLARQTLNEFGALRPGQLLVKRVAASGGDVVCREGDIVSINGLRASVAKRRAGGERPLPVWSGCSTLAATAVFLLGDHPASLDSRYFGPVSTSDIVGVIRPLVTFSDPEASQS